MNEFNSYNDDDPFLAYELQKKVVPDANFGIYYYTDKLYIGLSSHQLLQNQTLVFKDSTGNTQLSKLLAHMYFMTGIAVPMGDQVVFRPSLMAKFVKNAPPQVDVNASFLFMNTFWIGASYRSEKAVSIITEINVAQNLRIGYSYDMWMNELKSYNKGSHEIRLSYDFNVNKRMLTPRYF